MAPRHLGNNFRGSRYSTSTLYRTGPGMDVTSNWLWGYTPSGDTTGPTLVLGLQGR